MSEGIKSVVTLIFLKAPVNPDIDTHSLHDALPIYQPQQVGGVERRGVRLAGADGGGPPAPSAPARRTPRRSEAHTSELQSHGDLESRPALDKEESRCVWPRPRRARGAWRWRPGSRG